MFYHAVKKLSQPRLKEKVAVPVFDIACEVFSKDMLFSQLETHQIQAGKGNWSICSVRKGSTGLSWNVCEGEHRASQTF